LAGEGLLFQFYTAGSNHWPDALDHKKWRKLIRGEQSHSDGESGDSG